MGLTGCCVLHFCKQAQPDVKGLLCPALPCPAWVSSFGEKQGDLQEGFLSKPGGRRGQVGAQREQRMGIREDQWEA